MEHTKIFGLDLILVQLACIAVAIGALFFYVGLRNPGHKNESKWRQVWAYADVLAVGLTIVSVVKILSPLINGMQAQADASKRNYVVRLKEEVLIALDRAEDRFCPVDGVKEENVSTCDAVRAMRHSLNMPHADHVTANVIVHQILPKACAEAGCRELFDELGRRLDRFGTYYRDNRSVIETPQEMADDDVKYTLAFVFIYMLVSSFRLGRSGAEIERNRFAQREAAAKAKSPISNSGLGDVHARMAQLEAMIALLVMDSDTCRLRQAALSAVAQSAVQHDALRAELAHLSGTAAGRASQWNFRAACAVLLVRICKKFGLEALPIVGRWFAADPQTDAAYCILTIARSTMSWCGYGRLRARRTGKYALVNKAVDIANGEQLTFVVDVHVDESAHAPDRLELSFPGAGNVDFMEMTEYRQGKPVSLTRFRRLAPGLRANTPPAAA